MSETQAPETRKPTFPASPKNSLAVEVTIEAPVEQIEAVEGENQNSPDSKPRNNQNRNGDRNNRKPDTREKKPRRNMYAEWEKEITVTLETEIPEIPKERLTEPNNDDLRTKLKDLDKEINTLRDSITLVKTERSDAIDADRKLREEKAGNLKGLFKEVKDLNQEITELNDEKKLLESDIEKRLWRREQVVKGIFGKKIMKPAQCEDQIDELDHRQKTEKLTANEERAILKDLKELRNSLPLIKEADAIDAEVRDVKDTKKIIGGKIRKKIDARNAVNLTINEVKAKQKAKEGVEGEEKVDFKKEDRPKHPMTVKIDGIKEKIEAARTEKQAMKDAHDKHYKDWRDQNELEQKIKWIKKQKYRLQKIKEQEEWEAGQKAEEDKIRDAKEEYERVYGKPKKYQSQIDVCDNLITFVNGLKPRTHEDETLAEKYNEANVEAKLQAGDWKKEKVHMLKKPQEEEGVKPGQKKHKKQSKNAKSPEDNKLTLTIETLSLFDQIKVSPASYAKEIDGTIKQLNEKRDYFIKMSDDINEGVKTEAKEAVEGEAKVEATAEEGDQKDALPEKKAKKEKRVKIDDEDMFPSL